MKRVFVLIILTVISFAVLLPAQSRQSRKAFRKGSKFYRKYEFNDAIPYFRAAINLDPTDPLYPFLLGECYFKSGLPRESLPYFERAWKQDPETDSLLTYYLGYGQHLKGNFKDAKQNFETFLRDYAEPGSMEYSEASIRIKQCESGLLLSKSPPKNLQIENLGEFVNTRFPEYAASFSQDYNTMIFTSRRPKDPKKMEQGEIYAEDINEEVYRSESVDGVWMKTVLFSRQISKFTHDAGIGLSEDGNTLFYYVDRDSGDVFVSRKKSNGKWDRRKSIGDSVNTRFHEPSAFITQDGNILLFVSTRPGGQGGKDIWWAQRMENGEWGNAQNLGPRINTSLNEDAPFLSQDGKTLYFASEGHSSMGGYDIFSIEWWGKGATGKLQNMGLPLNSAGDDLYYVERRDGKGFYFTSDRPGGFGEKDIYFGTQSALAEESAFDLLVLEGRIMDYTNREPVDAEVRWVAKKEDAILARTRTEPETGLYKMKVSSNTVKTARLEAWIGDSLAGEYSTVLGRIKNTANLARNALVELLIEPEEPPVQATHSAAPEGKYFFSVEPDKNYYVRVSSPGYETSLKPFEARPSGQIRVLNFELKETGSTPVDSEPNVSWVYFDSGRDEIKSEFRSQLEVLAADLSHHPEWRVKVVGFADPVGSKSFNQALSRKRAEKVAKFLIARGVSRGQC